MASEEVSSVAVEVLVLLVTPVLVVPVLVTVLEVAEVMAVEEGIVMVSVGEAQSIPQTSFT